MTSDGFALFFRHVWVDVLTGLRVRVFPHAAPKNGAIDVTFVDVRLDPAVGASESVHNLHGGHFCFFITDTSQKI